MSKKLVLIISVIIVVCLLISGAFVFFTKSDGKVLEVIKASDCKKEFTLYDKKRNIYTECLKSIKVKYNRKTMELKDYLDKNRDIEEVTELLELTDTLKSDDNKVYQNEKITIIVCQNKKIYIGPEKMEYTDNLCD